MIFRVYAVEFVLCIAVTSYIVLLNMCIGNIRNNDFIVFFEVKVSLSFGVEKSPWRCFIIQVKINLKH